MLSSYYIMQEVKSVPLSPLYSMHPLFSTY